LVLIDQIYFGHKVFSVTINWT